MARKKTRRRDPKKDDRVIVTRRQLAELLGVRTQSVTRLVVEGMPIETSGGGRGRPTLFDAAEALAWVRERNETASAGAASSTRDEYLAALRDRVLQDIAVKSGALLDRDEVILAGRNFVFAWKAKLRAIPRQMLQRGLIGNDLERPIAAMLDEILLEISRWNDDDVVASKATRKGKS